MGPNSVNSPDRFHFRLLVTNYVETHSDVSEMKNFEGGQTRPPHNAFTSCKACGESFCLEHETQMKSCHRFVVFKVAALLRGATDRRKGTW
jgi:predicted nucleic acid binding AN1-type Zn finger protein